MNSAATNDRSWTMLENLTGTNNIYGNVFLGIQGGEAANGLVVDSSDSAAVFNIYNNTFVAKSGADNNVLNLVAPGVANIRNNIFYLQTQVMTGSMTKNRSFNHWFGSNLPSCSGLTGEICGGDPKFTNYAGNNFSLAAGSVDTGAATNLGTGPTGQTFNVGVAPNATWPGPAFVTRPGTWDRGAIQGSSSVAAPTAPTNLRVVLKSHSAVCTARLRRRLPPSRVGDQFCTPAESRGRTGETRHTNLCTAHLVTASPSAIFGYKAFDNHGKTDHCSQGQNTSSLELHAGLERDCPEALPVLEKQAQQRAPWPTKVVDPQR